MPCSSRTRAPRAKSAAISPQTFDTISGLLLDIRQRLDDLVFALEDVAGDVNLYAPEDDLEDGRAAARGAQQSIRAAERELELLLRAEHG